MQKVSPLSRILNHKYFVRTIVLLFPVLAVVRISSNTYSFSESLIGVDDWNWYARYAMDIYKNGWLIPSINDNYLFPVGFLYNYFIALNLLLFGSNLAAIYFVQSILLSLAIIVTYQTFNRNLSSTNRLLFLIVLMVFAYIDIYRYYTFHLLSENIAIVTVALFFYFIKKMIQDYRFIDVLLASIMLGFSCLARANLFPFALTLVLLLVLFQKQKKWALTAMFILVFVTIFSILAVRNYLVTQSFELLPVNGSFYVYVMRANGYSFTHQPYLFCIYYVKKIMFLLGFLPVLDSAYNFRPHWLFMWFGYFIYLYYFLRLKHFSKDNLFEIILTAYITIYFVILILIAPVESYGFRMVLPGLLLLVSMSFKAWLSIIDKSISKLQTTLKKPK